MSTIGDRLKYVIDSKCITSYRIATDLNIGKSTIANYLKNATKPDSSKLDAICSYLNLNKRWLITGEGEEYNDSSDTTAKEMQKNVTETDSETMKKLKDDLKRCHENVATLISTNKILAESLHQMKKAHAPLESNVADADVS